jgi:galactitol-specific phosphotransferase system IIC component
VALAFKKLFTPSLIGLIIGVIIGVLGETNLIGRTAVGSLGMGLTAIFAVAIRLRAGIQGYFSPTFFFIMGMILGVVAADFAIKDLLFRA